MNPKTANTFPLEAALVWISTRDAAMANEVEEKVASNFYQVVGGRNGSPRSIVESTNLDDWFKAWKLLGPLIEKRAVPAFGRSAHPYVKRPVGNEIRDGVPILTVAGLQLIFGRGRGDLWNVSRSLSKPHLEPVAEAFLSTATYPIMPATSWFSVTVGTKELMLAFQPQGSNSPLTAVGFKTKGRILAMTKEAVAALAPKLFKLDAPARNEDIRKWVKERYDMTVSPSTIKAALKQFREDNEFSPDGARRKKS